MVKVCDCFPELKDITDARERRYRAHPDKPAPEGPRSFVEVKVTSIGQLNELVDCKKSGYKFIISEPVHVGGQNVRADAARVPARPARSAAMRRCSPSTPPSSGVTYDSFEAVARTDFDVRGHMMADAPTLGVPEGDDQPSAWSAMRRRTSSRRSNASSFEGCPGINTLREPVPVETAADGDAHAASRRRKRQP